MRRFVKVLLGLGILALVATACVNNMWRFQPWSDGETQGRWTVLYTGHGRVVGTDQQVLLEPRPAASPDVTHGSLVHTTANHRDADFEITVRTEEQLREGEPNAWEVGWVLWNFQDTDHFYALALKPNGWEISKQDPDYPGSQRFVATGNDMTFPLGKDYRVEVEQDWPRMTVSVNGQTLGTVVDEERPYRGGAIGLYTEDARARFLDLEINGTEDH